MIGPQNGTFGPSKRVEVIRCVSILGRTTARRYAPGNARSSLNISATYNMFKHLVLSKLERIQFERDLFLSDDVETSIT
jgi:hypothetical protein